METIATNLQGLSCAKLRNGLVSNRQELLGDLRDVDSSCPCGTSSAGFVFRHCCILGQRGQCIHPIQFGHLLPKAKSIFITRFFQRQKHNPMSSLARNARRGIYRYRIQSVRLFSSVFKRIIIIMWHFRHHRGPQNRFTQPFTLHGDYRETHNVLLIRRVSHPVIRASVRDTVYLPPPSEMDLT